MLLFLMLSDFLAGNGPVVTLQRFSVPGQPAPPVVAGFLHLGVSAVYGGIFGLILYHLPGGRIAGLRKIIAGLVYGLLLYLIAITLLLPSSGSALLEVHPLVFGAAHAIYGVVLGRFTS
jgi:membrane associated rhomboid family serine protease